MSEPTRIENPALYTYFGLSRDNAIEIRLRRTITRKEFDRIIKLMGLWCDSVVDPEEAPQGEPS